MRPPIELPTRIAGVSVTASRKRSRSCRFASTVAARPASGVRPNPARSGATTRARVASPGPTAAQLVWEPPSPCTSTIVGPVPPKSAKWTGPSRSMVHDRMGLLCPALTRWRERTYDAAGRASAMSTTERYARPAAEEAWAVPGSFETVLRWEYEEGRDALLRLYQKGKNLQWDASSRIDWSLDLDPENPQGLPDEAVSIFGSDVWNRMTRQERATTRRHQQAWQLSQFLHGEQGALVCTAKIV